jgi:hypothetical protein
MEPQTIKVLEFHEGLSKRAIYHFIIDGDRLVHISHYALKKSKAHDMCLYYVDLGMIRNRNVLEVASFIDGLFGYISVFPAEDLPLNWRMRRSQEKSITIINDYELAYLDAEERRFLNEWNKYYRPMLNYVRREIIDKGGQILATDPINIHIKNDLKYPLSFMIPYSKRARSMSLTVLTKQIHQIWIIIRILKEFSSEKSLVDLVFEQGSCAPVAMVVNYAMWYEFDLNPNSMFGGIIWRSSESSQQIKDMIKRAVELRKKGLTEYLRLRPDIVFTYAKNVGEFIQKPAIKLVIECKNFDYTFWEGDVESQIKPYAEIFKPEHIVIASLKLVPQQVKKQLSNCGIDVVDNVYPGGSGEQELITYVKRSLS